MRSESDGSVRIPRASALAASVLLCGMLACQPPAALPAENTTTLSAAPPGTAPPPGSVVVKDELAVSAGATLPEQDLSCVTGPDPEIDKESAWSIETGQRLDKALPRLAACTRGLPPGETELTLRLVYGADGSSLSQHVVHSTPEACEVAACLTRELSAVPSPKLLIDRASYDIALVLERGSARRASEPPDVLSDGDEASCVDRGIAALSRQKIKEVVSASFTGLRTCYGQALMRDHSVAGNVTFEFVIGQAGKVARAQVRDATLPDCGAIQCMLAEFRGLEFPEPVGRSVRVIYPINYVLEQDAMQLK
jgi:hypothetical protein